jgi:hypothetical protein
VEGSERAIDDVSGEVAGGKDAGSEDRGSDDEGEEDEASEPYDEGKEHQEAKSGLHKEIIADGGFEES